jgi:formate dehydrogenase iron-sulfur subunit
MLLGGIIPLALLAAPKVRQNTQLLFISTLLACGGVVLNRMNVVLFGMTLHGRMPQTTPSTYMPSIFEWGISVGLIASTVFLFGLGARYLPVLPKEEQLVSGD